MKNLILTAIILISLICVRTVVAHKYENSQPTTEVSINIIDTVIVDSIPEFSKENLKEALDSHEITEPDIVYRQAVLETGNFTSNLFITNNNLFGMKHPSVRETTSTGKKNGYACYDHWIDSVKDMVLFQEFYSKRISKYEDYYDFLDGIYATDNSYSKKLKGVEI